MFTRILAAVALSGLIGPAAAPSGPGELAWFAGSFEEALEKARSDDTLVFLDFWTEWCGWCQRLDQDTFSEASVAREMSDVVCLSIDAESEEGARLAQRFAVRGYPALILVDASGEPQDAIGGYLPPADFIAAVQRVKRGEGTVRSLRARIAAEPEDLETRFELARKLKALGDAAGHDRQLAEIRRRDPGERSLPLRRLSFDRLVNATFDDFEATFDFDGRGLRAFLREEEHTELLFEGWATLAFYEDQTGDDAAARASYRNAWPHTPESWLARMGNEIARSYWKGRRQLSATDKTFALEVARRAAEEAGESADALDTLACCLLLNGRREDALATLERARKLDLSRATWRRRRAEFRAEGL